MTEIVNPPATETQLPKPEILKETQAKEIADVASTQLFQKITEITTDLSKKTTLEQEESKKDRGIRIITQATTIIHKENGDYNENGQPGVTVEVKPPVEISINGSSQTVTRILRGEDNTFICQVKDKDGKITDQTIGRDQLVLAQIASERTAIVALFPPEQQALIDLYLQSVSQGTNALEGKSPDEINKIIQEGARSFGLLTTQEMGNFLSSLKPNESLSTEETEKFEKQKETVIKSLEGKNIIDYETGTKIFESFGHTKEELPKQLQDAQTALTDLKNATPPNEDKIKEAQIKVDMLSTISYFYDQEDTMKEVLENGIGSNSAKLFEALKKGNVDEIVNSIIPDSPTDTPEEKKEKEEKRLTLKEKMIIYGASGGIGLFAFIIATVASSLKEAIA